MAIPGLVRTREGYEMQFATNFLGHFALTVDYIVSWQPQTVRASCPLSSSANMIAPVLFDDLHFNFLPYEPFVAYGQSKTATVFIRGGGYSPLDG